ncbi:MAG: ComEA family DNA-binding protein [Flammeovirgaceae bacterium]
MKYIRSLIVFVGMLMLSLPTLLVAQDFPRENIDLDAFIQELFAQQDEDVAYEDLYESLFQLYRNPLNLNRADAEDLRSLFVLSEAQINNFLKHRNETGKLVSIYELQAIAAFDQETIYKLLPFVTVRDVGLNADSRSLFQRIRDEENQFLLIRYQRTMEEREGFRRFISPLDFPFEDYATEVPNYYLGSPDAWYVRYRLSHSQDFSLGFTLEKDAGEEIVFDRNTRRYGADFISYHATFYNQGNFKAIALGDYQIQFGQGLLMSAGFQVGKGTETVNTVRRSHTGIRPYTSVLETGFLRGAAATYEMGQFELTGFYSRMFEDASIDLRTASTVEFEEGNQIAWNRLAAFQTNGIFTDGLLLEDTPINTSITGFHRTPSEIARKDRIRVETMGGNLSYESKDKNLLVGATVLNTVFSIPLNRDSSDYNQYEFRGKDNLNLGFHYSYNWRNFNFFGEVANSSSGGIGFLSGFVSSLSRTVQLAMLYRHYDRDFHSFYGAAFGEYSTNINESGMYIGVKVQPNRNWIFTAYYDQYKSNWLRFRTDAPSDGNDVRMRLTHKPNRKTTLYAQFSSETKELNVPDNTSKIDFILPATRNNYLINADFRASKYISLRSRLQFSTFEQVDQTNGFAAIQDVNFDFRKVRLSTRFALFDTDNFENRQYVYEKDVLFSFSIPAYSGRGYRNYYLLQLKPTRNIDIWIRYAITTFLEKDEVGSGLQEIDGSRISELKVQLRYKF